MSRPEPPDEVEFEITCSEESGAIGVITATGGSEPDENGYILMLDDQERVPIDNDDEQTIPGLTPGDHIVELGDVAENCEVAGENRRTVTVTVTTEGTPDDTEFALTLDGGDPQTIEFDGELTLREVSEGSHEVVLEVASNCTVPDDGLQTVDVTAGETAVVSYDVDCSGTSTARR